MSYIKLILLTVTLSLITSSESFRQRSQRQRQPKKKNCYEKLGVATDVTDRQIKKAFRKLAMQYHPDKVKADQREKAESKFKELAYCYELLSDKDQRQKYDASGYNEEFAQQSGPSGGNFHFEGNFEDIFSNFFGKGNNFGFENLFNNRGSSGNAGGFPGGFSFGTGGGGGGPQFGFGGGGRPQQQQQQNMYGQHHQHMRSDKKAKTQAKKVYVDLDNLMEDSFQSVSVKRFGNIELEIPKGCPDGHVIEENGIAFEIYASEHDDYKRGLLSHKSDLYTNVSITLEQALLGFNLEVMTIDNELIQEWIEEMPHSHTFQIKRKGLPRFGSGATTRGHLYVSFDVQLPQLNEQERSDLKTHLDSYGGWDYSQARKYRKKEQEKQKRRNKRRNRDKSEL